MKKGKVNAKEKYTEAEIRAKRKIDKLSILSTPMAKVVRGGKKLDIPVEEIVLDEETVDETPADEE